MREPFVANWMALVGALTLPAICQAADFPSQLWGRSVTVSWTANRSNDPSAASSVAQLNVYVSGAGRTFSRMTIVGTRTTRSNPGTVETATSMVNPSFKNGTLLVDATASSDTIRVAISFDIAYGTCTARVFAGRDENTPTSGREISASRCSIADGNVFVGR